MCFDCKTLFQIRGKHLAPGIGWHIPVSTRGESHRSYLRTVRHTGAFELLTEEAAYESLEPFEDSAVVILAFERLPGKECYLVRTVAAADEVVDEEVVEFVWSYKIFRNLLYFIVFIGWEKFRADRSVHDVQKDFLNASSFFS